MQLLLYAGGVVTIVVFAIVVTERLVGDRITQTSRHLASGAIWRARCFVARPAASCAACRSPRRAPADGRAT